MTKPQPLPGAGRCPSCGSRKVRRAICAEAAVTRFYAGTLEVCGNPACKAIWEPFDPAELLDADAPRTSSFRAPCDNCAFRSGSVEQRDPDRWRALMATLKGDGDPYGMLTGSGFYCHKGVPLDPGSERGFAYPNRRVEVAGRVIETPDRQRLRPCRGWLRMVASALDSEVPRPPEGDPR